MALEKTLPINADLTNNVNAGCVVHIKANRFILGVDTTTESTTQLYPPLFAFQNETDFDVDPDLGNIAGGVLMALSCLGAFELESTQTAAAATFAVGQPLTSDDAANALAAAGTITTGTLGTDTICGIVSETGGNADGTFENEHGQNVVRFWTCYFPAPLTAA
jgi:hypothetical protein